jgi:hypothetical protein
VTITRESALPVSVHRLESIGNDVVRSSAAQLPGIFIGESEPDHNKSFLLP